MAKRDHTKIFLMASLYGAPWQESFENRFVLKQHKSFNKLGSELSIFALPKNHVPNEHFEIANNWQGLTPLITLNNKSKAKLCCYYLQHLSDTITETKANDILDAHTSDAFIEDNFYLLNSVYAYTGVNADKNLKKKEKNIIKSLGNLMAYSYSDKALAKIFFDISSHAQPGTPLTLEAVGLELWKDMKKENPDIQGLCIEYDSHKKWLIPEAWVNENARKLLTKPATKKSPKL